MVGLLQLFVVEVRQAARALASAGNPLIDAVVVATASPDRICPALAPEVAARLGLGKVAAYDINSACSGFVYGLATASGLIYAGIARHVLLIGAEAFTTMVNPNDRNTRPIFGDGAGAVVLRVGDNDEAGAFGPFDLGSDGELPDLLSIAAGGSRQRSLNGLGHENIAVEDWYLKMDGPKVYGQAVTRMTESAQRVLKHVGWTCDDIDWFVGHQANARILRTVGFELGLPDNKVADNIARVGNTVTASIPLLLNELATNGPYANVFRKMEADHALPVPLVRHAVRRRKQRSVLAQHLADLARGPRVGEALHAGGVGIKARGKAATRCPEVAQQRVKHVSGHGQIGGITCERPRVHIHPGKLGVVVEHLLKVRHQPCSVRGVATPEVDTVTRRRDRP